MIILKKIISAILTLIILITLNFSTSKLFNLLFIDLSFIVGALSAASIWFFSTEGGALTLAMDAKWRRLMESDSRRNNKMSDFRINTPFVVSLVYTIVAAIATFITYKDYFI